MSPAEELFLVAGIWTVITLAIAGVIFRSWPLRAVFVAIAVGILFWEVPFGYYHFRRSCGTELELQVFEQIQPQRIVCADYPGSELAPFLLKYGFEFVEQRDRNKVIRRLNGSMEKTSSAVVDALESKYCVTYEQNIPMPWRMLRTDYLIVESRDRRVVARQSSFYWSGTYWQQANRPMLGRGGQCESDFLEPIATALRDGRKQ
jgi:hypothetical protein